MQQKHKVEIIGGKYTILIIERLVSCLQRIE